MRPTLSLSGNEGFAPRSAGQGGWDRINDAPSPTQATLRKMFMTYCEPSYGYVG